MAGIKNFNLTGIAADIQLGKRGGRFVFDENDNTFKFFESDGTTAANVETNDLTINGNLTVLGDTTTINVETLTVQDNLIEINSGEAGAGVTAGTAGIDINRGSELNAQIIWDEANDTIRFQYSDGTLLDIQGNTPVQTSESLYRDSDGKVILDGSGATSASAEYIDFSTSENTVTLTAKNEAGSGDIDLVLTTQGNGSVVIASSDGASDGFLGSVDGVDLTLSGGDEGTTTQTGNLILTGGDGTTVTGGDVVLSGGANGGTVRIDTAITNISDASSDDTVSTVKYVRDKVAEIDTAFIASSDTPETFGTAGQYVVINGAGDGLEFADLPSLDKSINDLTDTPEAYGTAGQVLAVNSTTDGMEYVDVLTSFIGADDTPVSYGTAGQFVVINSTADGLEFVDAANASFTSLDQTPEALGTTGQMLVVNALGDALEFVDQPDNSTSVIGLTDTPEAYGTEGQVLAVNSTADGFEFVDVENRTLNAVELADMYSSLATYDATSGAYAVVATPQAYTDSNTTTQRIVVTRMTLKVSTDLDAGVGFKVIVQNDVAQTEASVIDNGDNTDVLEGVYVIDGIFQDVSFDTLQNVSVALVDVNGDPIAATAGSVSILTEYKTVFV